MYERAFGKARQAIDHAGAIGSYELTRLTDDQLTALVAILAPAVTSGEKAGGRGERQSPSAFPAKTTGRRPASSPAFSSWGCLNDGEGRAGPAG